MSEPTPPFEESVPERPADRAPDMQSPGEMLRDARLAHDWSIEDLCAETKLSEKSVNALENNAFNELSQPIFAGGYYRQCAKVLDIDSERMMAAYAAWGGQKTSSQTAAPAAVDVVPQDVTPSNWRVLAAIGAIVLLVIVGAVFLFMPVTNSDDVATADSNDAPAAATGDDMTRDTASTIVGSGNSSATSNGRPAGSASQDTGTSLRVSPAPDVGANTGRRSGGRNVNDSLGIDREAERSRREAQSAPEPQVEPNHLVVTFTDRSWVDIRDAGGARLLRGIFEAGDTREFDAEAPYSITLGYAPGVDMTIGGQDVDIESQTSSNSTARLTVEARDDTE